MQWCPTFPWGALGFFAVRDRGGGRAENGAELAGGEGVQGVKTALEFGGRQAALAKKAAKMIIGGGQSLLHVAFGAAGNEIAVGVGASAGFGNNVVEAAARGSELDQAVEAESPFARMNRIAESFP